MSSVELWKSFVDEFAQLHDGVFEKWVLQEGSYPNRQENSEINEFLTSLTVQQREILVKMLINARHGGIHDALVRLNDRMDCKMVSITKTALRWNFSPLVPPFTMTMFVAEKGIIGSKNRYYRNISLPMITLHIA